MDVKLDGLELVVYGDNSRTRENQILSILLGMTMYTRQKCFLSYKEVFLIENVFVKNCLGKSEFNTHRLVDLLKSGK